MNQNLPQSAVEMTDILDIADVYRDGTAFTIKLILGILLAILVLTVLFFLLRGLYRKFFNKEALLTPVERAKRDLSLLKKRKLVDDEKFREFYFVLDEILRRFLKEEHGCDVVEHTFEELGAYRQKLASVLDDKQAAWLYEFWRRAQQVKFAKEAANKEEASDDLGKVERMAAK